jgi:recombination protein RecA
MDEELQFGKGAVVQLGGQAKVEPAAVISTGSLTLDRAVGIGGLPKGCV